tara:strand:+ start:407 stop:1543 length:1137 start_codon:yes stop_codon:yes gene_type:complete
MKKIFILTGEPSGDKLASKVISKLKQNHTDIDYLSVGGSYLNSIGIKSIFELQDITYIGFTSVILNIFKIKKKISETINKIIEFNPDILLSVDSPDFTLRVVEKVKEINPKIKTIHYVAPQVWAWRKGRIKKFKKFLDHVLLLFKFEKKFFDKEKISSTFVGHPLLDNYESNNIDLSNLFNADKKLISLFAGSRSSEISILLPILLDFIKLMNDKFKEYHFVFHATDQNEKLIKEKIIKSNLENVDVISNEHIKSQILSKSKFAVAKSGTISLEICNLKIPSIIIYKMNYLNFIIVKLLVKTKYANIINIINQKEIIPELLQKECNAKEIFKSVVYLLKNPKLMNKQINQVTETLNDIRSKTSSSDEASAVISSYLGR